MSGNRTVLLLSVAFAVACVAGLWIFFADADAGRVLPTDGTAPGMRRPMRLELAWRTAAFLHSAARPCAVADGWVVADDAGCVAKVSLAGKVLWQASFSNEAFSGASALQKGDGVVVASESGRVYLLEGASGREIWRCATDGRFAHAPLVGARETEEVLWLISQDDGRLFCLRAANGTVDWVSDATNRCDGEPIAQSGLLAYGNCDGAVYVFDAATGRSVGKIAVGDEDQMAGGMLALPDGCLVIGTRAGRVVVVDPVAKTRVAVVKVAEGECFVTPTACFSNMQFAVVVDGVKIEVWDASDKSALRRARAFAVDGGEVTELASVPGGLLALVGGVLMAFDESGERGRLSLGDAVGAVAVNGGNAFACVADGALAGVKGAER